MIWLVVILGHFLTPINFPGLVVLSPLPPPHTHCTSCPKVAVVLPALTLCLLDIG